MKKLYKSEFGGIIIFFAILGILSIISYILGFSICIFYNITGVYCPSCGMTRAFVSLLNLDFKSAFMYNPMFILVPLSLIPIFIDQFFFKIKKSTLNKYFFTLIIILLVTWIIRLALYFPYDPVAYNENNLLLHLYSTIKDSFR